MRRYMLIVLLTVGLSITSCGTTEKSSGSSSPSRIHYPLSSIIGHDGTIDDFDENFVGTVLIPPEFEGVPVTEIGDYAFASCNQVTRIVIPDGVTTIGKEAFADCSSLESIHIADSVVSINEGAFKQCTSLVSVDLPIGLTVIEEYVFADCSSLLEVTVPDGMTAINRAGFFNCTSINTISIPSSVETIGGWSFFNCEDLTEIFIPISVTSMGSQVFRNCDLTINCQTSDSPTPNGWADDWQGEWNHSVVNWGVPTP